MDRPRINRLSVKNFACIKDATFDFAQLSALIGPNDSGKSMVLRALRALTLYVAGREAIGRAGDRLVLEELLKTVSREEMRLEVTSGSETLRIDASPGQGIEWSEYAAKGQESLSPLGQKRPWTAGSSGLKEALRNVHSAASGSLLVRLEPDSLRRPSSLILPGQAIALDDPHQGLAGILDAIRDRGDGSFEAIREQLCALFPAVKYLQLSPISDSKKVLQIELTNGARVPANLLSEGILYFLAFAAIAKIERPPLLLIEEPENGLHPARIADVMEVLRKISETSQVVIATHSPLVVNAMKGDEVIVLTRSADTGTQARLLKDTFNYEERSRVYENGELWLSYANGRDEHDLLTKPETAL